MFRGQSLFFTQIAVVSYTTRGRSPITLKTIFSYHELDLKPLLMEGEGETTQFSHNLSMYCYFLSVYSFSARVPLKLSD